MPGRRKGWSGAGFTKVYGDGPVKVTLVLPEGSRDPNAKPSSRGYYHKRNIPTDRITWYYCPNCHNAYDKVYKPTGGCFCTPVYDGHSEPVSWAPNELRKMPDQEAAEAAFMVGGIEAVSLIAAQLKEPADEQQRNDPPTDA